MKSLYATYYSLVFILFCLTVVHHIDSTIPHYKAKAATENVKRAFPDIYLYEPTPVFQAMWRLATKCFIVEKRKNIRDEDVYVFVDA